MLDEQAKDFEKGQNHKNVYQRICVHLRLSAANPNFKTLSELVEGSLCAYRVL